MTSQPSIIALIPARAGSKRVPGKNIRPLAGHPLIAYTIAAALKSGIFERVIVSTDSEVISKIAQDYGGEVPCLRSSVFAMDNSPDIDWIREILTKLKKQGEVYDCYSILRPTSPFRQYTTIQRAWEVFLRQKDIDSLRAVEKCQQHPGKMWVRQGDLIEPLLTGNEPSLASQSINLTTPWHSSPYQALPEVYSQNASLEIAWCRVVWETDSIAGTKIVPFFTEGFEGLDINDAKDWWYAEYLLQQGEGVLPSLSL
ncbi:MAG: acylneuraminate cytidylyltransferase family protein [Gloeocapsa sp. DLM2.Bin57]|nr:MAG: acylneuraminate cytidylyltransferase family protein [Gloeocapsa sp. DLM2.Bin57]